MARAKAATRQTDSTADPVRRSKRVVMQKAFQFFELIPEIRNIIYKMALQHDDTIELRGRLKRRPPRIHQLRGLTQVSRACRQESLLVFWSINRFRIHVLSNQPIPFWNTVEDRMLRDAAIGSLRYLAIDRKFQLKSKERPNWDFIQLDLTASDPMARVSVHQRWPEAWPPGAGCADTVEALNTVVAALFWRAGTLKVTAEAIKGLRKAVDMEPHTDIAKLVPLARNIIRIRLLDGFDIHRMLLVKGITPESYGLPADWLLNV